MGRHAYLIMAHNQPEVLIRLLQLIDDSRNDIYLHLDTKFTIDENVFRDKVTYSNIYLAPRMDVHWGGFSQVRCSFSLFKMADETENYDFYHLLSGVDLPLKSQNELHDFFDLHLGEQFVSFDDECLEINWHRVKYRWLLQEKKGYKNKNVYNFIDKLLIAGQKIFKMDFRNKKVNYKLGSNWVSLSADFVKYLVSHENEIVGLFKNTVATDEMYIQTLLYNSPYASSCYNDMENISDNLRYTDFEKGSASPRIINEKDIHMLMNSKYLFARKFDYDKEPKAVELLYNSLIEQEK